MISTLFSVEIFIDRVRLHESVDCGFPSTVFKFLDYEPVQISQYPKDLVQRLKPLIQKRRFRGQLDDLKDTEGNFIIKKGKSVLFSLEPGRLLNYLSTVPVYLLLVDTLTEPCKLLGTCSLPIGHLAGQVYDDIMEHGIGLPACRETAGNFRLVSLMGHNIGTMTLKLRLMSVGPSIIPHVPEETLMKKSVDIQTNLGGMPMALVASKDAATQLKGRVQRVVVVERPEELEKSVEVEEERVQRPHVDVEYHFMGGDVFQPPPMYYNSHAIDPRIDRKLLKEIATVLQDDSDVDSIDIPAVSKRTVKIAYPKPKKRVTNRHKENEKFRDMMKKVEDSKEKEKEKGDKEAEDTTPKDASEPQRLPLLNALLEELQVWKSQDGLSQQEETQHTPIQPTSSVKRQPRQRPASASRSRRRTKPQPGGFKPDVMRRLSSPKLPLPSPEGYVPKGKGWIRTEPAYRGPLTSRLNYRVTHTHKMRLQMRNPEAYEAVSVTESAHEKDRKESLERTYELIAKRERSADSVTRDRRKPGPDSHQRAHARALAQVPRLFGKDSVPSVASSSPPRTSSNRRRGGPELSSTEEPELVRLRDPSEKEDRVGPGARQDLDNTNTGSVGEGLGGDDFVAFNPMQSNRSPQMSGRSGLVSYPDHSATQEHPQPLPRHSISSSGSQSISGPTADSESPMRPTRLPIELGSNESQETSEWRTSGTVSPSMPRPPPSPGRPSRKVGSTPPRSPPKSPVGMKKPFASGIMRGGRVSSPRLRRASSGEDVSSVTGRTGGPALPSSMNNHSVESSPTKATSLTRVTRFDPPGRPNMTGTEDSVSSYVPSDQENISFTENTDNYSDDFEKE